MNVCCTCNDETGSIQNDYRQVEPFYLNLKGRHDFNALRAMMVLLVKNRGTTIVAATATDHLYYQQGGNALEEVHH